MPCDGNRKTYRRALVGSEAKVKQRPRERPHDPTVVPARQCGGEDCLHHDITCEHDMGGEEDPCKALRPLPTQACAKARERDRGDANQSERELRYCKLRVDTCDRLSEY